MSQLHVVVIPPRFAVHTGNYMKAEPRLLHHTVRIKASEYENEPIRCPPLLPHLDALVCMILMAPIIQLQRASSIVDG